MVILTNLNVNDFFCFTGSRMDSSSSPPDGARSDRCRIYTGRGPATATRTQRNAR